MQRKDRETSRDETLAILDRSSWGVLTSVNNDGSPYGIPLSLARDGDCLYFHCALKGQKLKNLRSRPEVCIVFVGSAEVPINRFTVFYESAVVFGTAEEVTSREEKIQGLRIISERFTPENMHAFNGEIEQMLDITGLWKIHINGITGKRRKP
ncbi:MAG: pyridoxamine 5'-phosphate oxidase family protein [Treponema sp.]|nr:pyridoxamine 5'-phosphate oxidase family protein [Treponema sp.]